jgi:hypothetical protein
MARSPARAGMARCGIVARNGKVFGRSVGDICAIGSRIIHRTRETG